MLPRSNPIRSATGAFRIDMKVLHVFKRYLPESQGGIEQVIYHLSRATRHKGVENTILCLCNAPCAPILKREEATVVQCHTQFDRASTPFGFGLFPTFYRCLRQTDLIHYHFPYPVQDLLHILFRVKKPSIVTYHSDIVRQKTLLRVYRPLMHLFLSKVDAIVATSENYMQTSDTLQKYRDKVRAIPIGINRESMPAVEKERVQQWRDRVGEDFFLFVGVLRYYKGLDILLQAATSKKHKIVIAGAGPLEAELKEKARKLLLDNVLFVGRISEEDKVALLSLCHAIVFPSHLRSEAFGVSLVEGAMFGKPLISAEIGTGTTFVNIDKLTGIVVPPSDPQALSRAMDTLANNRRLAASYGLNAQQRYEQFFNADRMAAQYYELYAEMLAQRRG